MIKLQIVCLILLALMAFRKQPVKVIPLGDSITYGAYGAGMDGVGGYRSVLAKKCQAEGLSVDFVGTLNYPEMADFDADNQGMRGWRIDQIDAKVKSWISQCKPDVILLQIGVNDFIQGASVDTTAARLDKLMTDIFKADKNVELYTASIMGVLDSNLYKVKMPMVVDYNQKVEQLVRKHSTKGMKVNFTDINKISAFNSTDFHADKLHPNDRGYAKMADAWWSILKNCK
jgi:lysophospholipase L1-like esterase